MKNQPIILAFILLTLSYLIFWIFFKPHNLESKILIPKGYIGPVVIQFGQADGQDAISQNGDRIFKVSEEGILITNAPYYSDVQGYDFFYVDKYANEQEIKIAEQSYLSKVSREERTAIFCFREFLLSGLDGSANYVTFFISPIKTIPECNSVKDQVDDIVSMIR